MQSLQGKPHLTPRSWVPLGVTLLLLSSGITLFSPTARAAFIAPVQTFVGVVASAQSYSVPQGAFSSQVNFTWHISPSDPDQLNGALNYTFYEQNASTPGGWQCLRGCLTSVGSALPIPGRPGWLYLIVDTAPGGFLFQTANGTQLQFNMTANTAGGFASDASCTILLAVSIIGNQAQCGSGIINPPGGLSALVTTPVSPTSPQGYENFSWTASPDDPNGNLVGTTTDQSGNSNNIVQGNDSTLTNNGYSHFGLTFTNASLAAPYTSIPIPSGSNLASGCFSTVSIWFNANSSNIATGQTVYSVNYTGPNEVNELVILPNQSIRYRILDNAANSQTLIDPTPVQPGVWYNYLGQYDCVKQVMNLYRNATLIGTLPTTVFSGIRTSVVLGRNANNGLSQFNGTIDNLAFWNRSLSTQEVSAVYNGNLPSGLAAYYPFEAPTQSFAYRLTGLQQQQSGAPFLVFNFTAPNSSFIGNGVWAYTQTTTSNAKWSVSVRAEDTYGTHLVSNYTCQIQVDVTQPGAQQSCGNSAPINSGANGISTTPLFPFMSTSTFANSLGISQDLSNLLLASILILIIAGIGWYIAGAFGLIFAAILGIVLSGSLGLIPFWLFLFIFTIGAGAFVLAWRTGRNTQ